MDKLRKRIQTAAGKRPADTVIKNGYVLDSYNLELIKTDVAIVDGVIAGIGKFDGAEIIDAEGKYVVPSLIDAHVHIESAMVTPTEFAKAVLPHGVTAVVTDPHEIANVCGSEGLSFMLDDSESVPMDIFFMLPSSVPSTSFENAGATLTAKDLKPFYQHERVLGLAEVMDYPSVAETSDSMMQKLHDAHLNKKKIDGHAAGLDSRALNIYKSAGIDTDHECITADEALERISRGMYVLIREGSVAKNLKQLLPAVTERNARRFMFCTDDKHLNDLLKEGSVDHNIRLAIKHGMNPLLAIQMATLNAAECYGLKTKGALAPGHDADFLLLDNLESFSIEHVYRGGKLVAENGSTEVGTKKMPAEAILNSVHIPELTQDNLRLSVDEGKANVIEIIPNQLVTNKLKIDVDRDNDNAFMPSAKNDLMKLAVIERHHHTGNIGLGIVKGLKFKRGAIASTVGHDSHNLIIAGTNDLDMIKAAKVIQDMQGGLVVIQDEKVIGEIPLPIAGLLSDKEYRSLDKDLENLDKALALIEAPSHFNPFLTLSFLSLPVIPDLKLTDLGLFDVKAFRHISITE
ncbi:adenine deaminase [Pseudalkalibacillus hwajinpoensis]|uniref:Adenine deaminase n=1 Tax=Guptibacillus hwajinpoensis TaxID=208199 RepID=A0A4U1MI40_9BACL|nr:adenine deaminase [Pseudalkalibacillus hwajinpoensis]TKD70447.1 adenine deaminase [Pseudalkalibacillus hwajinpoensis]